MQFYEFFDILYLKITINWIGSRSSKKRMNKKVKTNSRFNILTELITIHTQALFIISHKVANDEICGNTEGKFTSNLFNIILYPVIY